jgi:hypothetical protein
MRIMVFLHGTALMQRSALGRPREERVRQVRQAEASVRDFASYVPVGGVAAKLRGWADQGAEIVYLSSHSNAQDVGTDEAVLAEHGFPAGPVFFRGGGEEYGDVVERVWPDVLIEDDCESIGGEPHMTYPHASPEVRLKVASIVVREFGGLDHLPDSLSELVVYADQRGPVLGN